MRMSTVTDHSIDRLRLSRDLVRERERIIALLGGCSLETSVHNPADVDPYRDQLDPGTDVYINHFPGETYHRVVAVAARLRRIGLNPVPHLAARNFVGFTQVRDLVERLVGEAQTAQVFVIAGDLQRPAGPYASSLDLLETGLFQKHGIRRIAIAGYPEEHRRIGAVDLANALGAKYAFARREGLDLYIVTQSCFEAAPILGWIERVRSSGVDLPIRIGLAGPASLRTLLKFALRCGIGGSIRALGSDAASITHLLAQAGPETIVRALAQAAAGMREEIAGLHFFPFGGVAQTAAWIRAVAAGRFEIQPGRDGFKVRVMP